MNKAPFAGYGVDDWDGDELAAYQLEKVEMSLAGGDCEEWTSAAMEDECGSAGSSTDVCARASARRSKIELASRDILA